MAEKTKKARKTIDPDETPRAKLQRLVSIRVGGAVTNMKNVAKLATYESLTAEDVNKIAAALETSQKETVQALRDGVKGIKPATAGGFSL